MRDATHTLAPNAIIQRHPNLDITQADTRSPIALQPNRAAERERRKREEEILQRKLLMCIIETVSLGNVTVVDAVPPLCKVVVY